jgi:3-phenylpropionate/trans-cinnamate dioxygenase ferredoxin reductase component
MRVRYCIVGGGMAAASAIEGIRSRDPDGAILVLTRENHRPYQRPMLSKELWREDASLERLPVHPDEWYVQQKVDLRLRHEVIEVDAEGRRLWDELGEVIEYEDLLIATGCRPRRLKAIGAETSSVRYFRDLEDYLDLERRLDRVQHLTLVGGGFISVEMAATLVARGKEVTLILADEYPLHRLLPRDLGVALVGFLREMGVETVSGDSLEAIEETPELVHARTTIGNELDTQLIIVDQGGEPVVDLAEAAGLAIDDGIVVDEMGRTSDEHVWSAGDVAEFPCLALGQIMRVEGSDHAKMHGFAVGANMAGAGTPYDHIPLKWFRVGDLEFEGVGELWARLDTEILWIEPGREGVVFYLRDDVIRGVLLVNVHERLEWARALVREARPTSAAERSALVTAKA